MTTITLPRAVVEQALEVINDTVYGAPVFRQEVRDTITALRAALAQPDPQDPELSAALGWPGGISDPVLDRKTLLQQVAALRAALAQRAEPVQEPAFHGFMSDDGTQVDVCFSPSAPRRDGTYATAYYTAPPQRKLVPLTEEEIDAEWHELDGRASALFKRVIRKFARAVEKASWEKNHGQA